MVLARGYATLNSYFVTIRNLYTPKKEETHRFLDSTL